MDEALPATPPPEATMGPPPVVEAAAAAEHFAAGPTGTWLSVDDGCCDAGSGYMRDWGSYWLTPQMEELGAPPAWDYVGMGRGGWVKDYKYVGAGAGDHNQRIFEEGPKPVDFQRFRLLCGGVSCCVALALLIYFSVLWSVLRSRWQHAAPPPMVAAGATAMQTPLPYECDDGWDADPGFWSNEVEPQKQAWCCDNYDRCATHAPKSNMDCTDGFETWEESWSVEQKALCCNQPNVVCVPATQTTTTSFVHNCDSSDKESVLETWSAENGGWRISWCCEHKGIACSTTKPKLKFDCEAGLSRWETGWSAAKKEYCCVTGQCDSSKVAAA
ncbi:unnamed protein product [Prorocentrum cordatum]|uniref:Cellulase n=1 Tax=Prorocentrum cordatum TaxID=2364126 RepID=A0ABN9T1Y9_9DINO|nr:unnamed protein product [Polarella glacialis]